VDGFIIMMGWAGLYAPVALGVAGSVIGCSIAGQAACGALLETDSGHGKYIGVSAMPSSQSIFGIVVMFALNRPLTVDNAAGIASIGILCGIALLFSGVYQGKCCASAINVSRMRPDIFGMSLAPAAIVEGFAVFAFIFALVLSADLPVVAV
jgi:V/A-type H+-transporting ATPase subunit K